jgi:UPF0716 protein FxsA
MFPARLLLLVLLIVPLLEIYVLVQAGTFLGALPVVLLVVLTAAIGLLLVRIQGLGTMARLQVGLDAGRLPAVELVEGVILLVAGGLLLAPGFVTDAAGFLCLVPSLRRRLAVAMLRNLVIRGQYRRSDGTVTIEGEFWNDEDMRKRLDHD